MKKSTIKKLAGSVMVLVSFLLDALVMQPMGLQITQWGLLQWILFFAELILLTVGIVLIVLGCKARKKEKAAESTKC